MHTLVQIKSNYYAYVWLNKFRAPLRPSSGAHDDGVGYHVGRLVLELLLDGSYVQVEWTSFRTGNSSILPSLSGPETHPSFLHLTSNQQQLENQTAYVVTNDIVVSS